MARAAWELGVLATLSLKSALRPTPQGEGLILEVVRLTPSSNAAYIYGKNNSNYSAGTGKVQLKHINKIVSIIGFATGGSLPAAVTYGTLSEGDEYDDTFTITTNGDYPHDFWVLGIG